MNKGSLQAQAPSVPTERLCGTCSHWSAVEKDWQFEALHMGRCTAIRQREDILEPARVIHDWDEREAEEERLMRAVKAVAVDGSGYYAAVRTTADFGCVLWSPTPTPSEETPSTSETEERG